VSEEQDLGVFRQQLRRDMLLYDSGRHKLHYDESLLQASS
jgi:hypothetical protein